MAGRRLALCVGINDYPGTGQDLNGCVNDALDWSSLLRSIGYTPLRLTDADATKANVVQRLRDLVDVARFGDRIVFTYSGHGSWVPDANGDEVDGRDECLVLHDFRNGGLLTDDEINAIFAARRFGVRVVVIPDACHSGTVHRFAGPWAAHPLGVPDARPRFLPPAAFLTGDQLDAAEVAPRAARGASRPTTALLSGCADTEYSYDAWIDGRYRGAFTAAALRTWSGQSLSAWHRAIRTVLPSDEYPQTPQLQATSSQRRWSL